MEWQLPRCPKIGRSPTARLASYCQTHGIRMDWLLFGKRSLQQMMQARRMGKAAATPESLKEKLARLSESEREVIRMLVDHLTGAT
jgi:hypothetical protein